jgi:nitrate/TMAO reductase-like tetraheme cytochrome c subunit
MRRVSDPIVLALLLIATLAVVVFMRADESHAAEVISHDFLGAERCRSCHVAEYEKWASGPHARAMNSLRESEKRDQRCIVCHTMVPADLDPMLTGIQCETCHGPGRYYAKPHVMRDRELRERLGFVVPDEKTCRACHAENTASLRPFSYPEARERIRHWPAEP